MENIDAIKQEVIGPIHTELEQNKVAGRFSVFGFWIGAFRVRRINCNNLLSGGLRAPVTQSNQQRGNRRKA